MGFALIDNDEGDERIATTFGRIGYAAVSINTNEADLAHLCPPDFFFWGICLRNSLQEEAAMKGLLGADRLITCPPEELHLKFDNVLRAFRPVGGVAHGDKEERGRDPALFFIGWYANVRVVSAYLDKVVSTYTDTKGRSHGRLFGSKSPIGDR